MLILKNTKIPLDFLNRFIYNKTIMDELKIKEMSLGERLRLLRERKGLLQKDLAQATGLSIQTISNLERDRGRPSISTIKKIAEVLKVPATVFFEDELKKKKLLRDELKKKMAQVEEFIEKGQPASAKALLDEMLLLFRSFGEEITAYGAEDDQIKKSIAESNLPEPSKDILLYLYGAITAKKSNSSSTS